MSLAALKKQIIADPENAWAKKKKWRPIYTAHEKAQILIVGQAPGLRAQESGQPWNDPSGDNLRNWLDVEEEVFYDPTRFALIPMDFYYQPRERNGCGEQSDGAPISERGQVGSVASFPGKSKKRFTYDLPPRKGFAEKWHPLLLAEMPQIKLTLLIGQYAQAYYLGNTKKKTLTETVKNYRAYGPTYFPLVHPSPRNNIWQKKNPWFKDSLLPELKKTVREII